MKHRGTESDVDKIVNIVCGVSIVVIMIVFAIFVPYTGNVSIWERIVDGRSFF
jgi:hypothetical protein